MKTIWLFFWGILCLSHLGLQPRRAQAQYMQNPAWHFDKMKFDMDVRGSYNVSYCVASHMNCWESMKPDLMCGKFTHYGSVCDILRDYCHDFYDDQAWYMNAMQVQERWCNYWEWSTK